MSLNTASKLIFVSLVAGPSSESLVRNLVSCGSKCRLALLVSSDSHIDSTDPKVVIEQLKTTDGRFNQSELRTQITTIAANEPIEHLVIECDARTHPMAFASLFLPDHGNESFLKAARLNSIVVSADAETLLNVIVHGERVSRVTSPCILADQIECANVIVLNSEARNRHFLLAQAIVSALNPSAQVLQQIGPAMPPNLLETNASFDFDTVLGGAGWQNLMRARTTVHRLDLGVTAFSYHARRPFHPERFWNRIQDPFMGIFRAKGFFWLATQMDLVGGINIAGSECHYSPAGQWWAAHAHNQGRDPHVPDRLRKEWSEPYGDRRQAIAFMGIDSDPTTLRAELDACLLTESQMRLGEKSWATLPDPFPGWGAGAHDHECKEHNCCHH